MSFGVLAHNLVVLFERKLGWLEAVMIGSPRYWLFVTAGVISHLQGKTTIKLAVPPTERDWWRRLWEKLLAPFPNCNAVENRPPLTLRPNGKTTQKSTSYCMDTAEAK